MKGDEKDEGYEVRFVVGVTKRSVAMKALHIG